MIMASMTPEERALFPLKTVSSVVALFTSMLKRSDQPDLALMSIIAGFVENTLTCNLPAAAVLGRASVICTQDEDSGSKMVTVSPPRKDEEFPEVELEVVEALHAKFRAVIRSSVDLSQYGHQRYASRELIKKVSDVIWNTLTRTYYKDRAHLQSLYSYLTGNKLDCFGVALAVVAGCQVLNLDDVHLALSEDHAWVVYGPDGQETAEVTWHGKGNEDKRGQPVDGGIQARSWLYVAGHPVVCSRFTEVAALVSSINPSVTATTDSYEVATMQQSLLWVLYDLGHLDRYPMALGNLGDLEEQSPTPDRCHCGELFGKAIQVSRRMYANAHVYPYTYQGGYFYRNRMYKEALESWANAADAIRSYNYSREDEEIYKEFLEIANELIPFVMKVEGSGHSARSILKDSECFAHLLRFYDGICQWEEGSCTPVLHIGWAKPLVNTISKFDGQVRRHVAIVCGTSDDEPQEVSGPPEESPEEGGVTQQSAGTDSSSSKPRLCLRSHKMAGLKDLLMAEKLNTHAISLQLTAQSQVQLGSRLKQQQQQQHSGDQEATNSGGKESAGTTATSESGAQHHLPSRPKRTRKE